MLCLIFRMGTLLLSDFLRLARALRLSIPLLYALLVPTLFRRRYLAHTPLADAIYLLPAPGHCGPVLGGFAGEEIP